MSYLLLKVGLSLSSDLRVARSKFMSSGVEGARTQFLLLVALNLLVVPSVALRGLKGSVNDCLSKGVNRERI